METVHIAIDTGGTFTDCVYVEESTLKVLKIFSTPEDPGSAVVEAVRAAANGSAPLVRHGTTVGTNVLLERKGARVAFVTTAGFEDIISIGRQARSHLYDWFGTPPPCIIPSEMRFGIAERTASDGTALPRPEEGELRDPARGVIGAYHVATLARFSRIIPLDMGGTSTEVCLVDENEAGPRTANDALISQMPIGVPMLDIHTIGAGGGSLARFDQAGILHVGPESAGANPGPVCYGQGTQPTVSDANLILGRLHPEHFLDGKVRLDCDRARLHMERTRAGMGTVEEFSSGIVLLAEAAMEGAIRGISVERGYDPREFTLVAFGGAGPLDACALASALQMPRVLVPACPGALSALGILLADTVRDYSKTVMLKSDADLEPYFRELEELAGNAPAIR